MRGAWTHRGLARQEEIFPELTVLFG